MTATKKKLAIWRVLALPALALVSGPAWAGLLLASYDTGSSMQQSYFELQAASRSQMDVRREGIFTLPYQSTTSATVSGVSAVDRHAWSSDGFTVEFQRHQKTGGSFITSTGAMIFAVDQQQQFRLDGIYSVDTSSAQEIQLRVLLQDVTTNLLLYDSYQWDSAVGGTYSLGGLTGNRIATLYGNATNTFIPGHVYAVFWMVSMDNFAPAAADAAAFGHISLNAVPEPSTISIVAVGFVLLLIRGRALRAGARGDSRLTPLGG